MQFSICHQDQKFRSNIWIYSPLKTRLDSVYNDDDYCADDDNHKVRAMLDTGKRQISLNTLEKLLKKQLGTEDMEQMSTKVIKDAEGKERDFVCFLFRCSKHQKTIPIKRSIDLSPLKQ